jgi:hypothetical protein
LQKESDDIDKLNKRAWIVLIMVYKLKRIDLKIAFKVED